MFIIGETGREFIYVLKETVSLIDRLDVCFGDGTVPNLIISEV